MTSTDRIEKQIDLKAPRSRVWQALTDAEQFGTWFGVKLEAAFVLGRPNFGRITYPGYEHLKLQMHVERIEAERLFAFRWHPHAIDVTIDYSNEPMTLVEFTLEDLPGGTRLTVVESGFDQLPASRRDEAFRGNSAGWAKQMLNIRDHVAG